MADGEATPPPENEKLKEFVAHATEVLKNDSVDQVLWVVQEISKNLGISNEHTGAEKSLNKSFAEISTTTMPKLCQCHCHDDKVDEVPVPPRVLQKSNRNMSSRLDHEAHPMHSDLILKNIFEFCSVYTLKRCRLVCTKWLELSLKSWRKKAVLDVEVLIDRNVVEDVLKEGSEFRLNPFSCYDIPYYERGRRQFEMKNKVLNIFSSSIRYLDFHCEDFDLAVSLILSKLPELRHVKLRFYYDYFLSQCQKRAFEGGHCPLQNIPLTSSSQMSKLSKLQLNFSIIFIPSGFNPFQVGHNGIPWIKFFERVPAITSLQVKYNLDHIYSGTKRAHFRILREILQSIKTVRESEGFTILNLQELDIMLHPDHSCITVPISKAIVDIIIGSKFPLERLNIDLGSSCKATCIQELLAAHEETLKYVKAISAPHRIYLKKTFAMEIISWMQLLPKLKELELLNGCVWAFHFLDSLIVPDLEVLTIHEMKLSQHRGLLKLNWKSVDTKFQEEHMKNLLDPLHFSNLKRFYYSGPRHFSHTELHLLAKAMPNVTAFGIPLSAKTFPVVCELWPRLKSLRVGQQFHGVYPLIDDYAITGLLPQSSQSKSDRVKNITDLKYLWSFVVDEYSGAGYSRNAVITDVSAVHGFLQLPKLVVLRIGAICKFSPEVRNKLESHVSDIYVNQPQLFEEDAFNVNSEYSSSSEDESESESEYSDPDFS